MRTDVDAALGGNVIIIVSVMAAECAAGRDIHKGRRRLLDTLKFHKPSVLRGKRSKGNPALPVGVHVSATLSRPIVSI